jgi:regulatory protein
VRSAAVQWPFKVIQGGVASPGLDSAGSVAAGSSNSPTSLGRGQAQAGPVSEVRHMADSSNKDARAPNVKARAVSLLAQREYSRQALQEKLVSENASPEQVEQALAQLEAKGLVDDTRVAETLVNRRAGKLGGMRLRQELQAKGVSPELVAETMAGLKDSELARALAIWQKKFGHVATDAATRNRQARFLATRGFSSDVVKQVVAGVEED